MWYTATSTAESKTSYTPRNWGRGWSYQLWTTSLLAWDAARKSDQRNSIQMSRRTTGHSELYSNARFDTIPDLMKLPKLVTWDR